MRVLHLEDSLPDAELVAHRLAQECPDCIVRHAASRREYEAQLETGEFDVILSDYTLNGFDGLTALQMAQQRCPGKPFIFLSGTIGEERAIDALKRGATDYIIKDRPSRLVPAIRLALAHAEEEQRLRSTEQALVENRERFRQIAENVADLIVMIDRAGRIQYCNPAYAHSVGEGRGQPHVDFLASVHADDRGAVRRQLEETLRVGHPARGDYRLVAADGTVRVVATQNTVVRDAQTAHSPQILIVARDVTAERAAVERIRQQAELLDRAQDAILMRDMQDRITYWNRSAARIYGWSAEEAQGRATAALWNEDPAQTEVARHATLFYGEWMGEMRQRSRQGAELIMQSRWSLVHGKDGSPSGFLVINTDIAEKKRLEAQFLRVQRTESIGLLAGGVAHDINNVLVPIMASTELLEPMVGDTGRQFIGSIRSSAQHGAALVRQLLAFARGAVGQHLELSLKPLLSDFVVFVTQAFPASVRVELMAPDDLWKVRGDETQLKQVLMNLCLNARDAMPDGGRIAIELCNQVLDPADLVGLPDAKPGPHVAIVVTDTGTGMPPEVVERIFDPFFTTKDVGKGTGLGLAAVHGIVKGHNGAVAVNSVPGRGTTFKIYLPAITAAAHPTPVRPRDTASKGAGQTILLVDDDESVRNILSAVLTASSYRILKAASAAQALTVFEEHRGEINLVLSDVMMSDSDGFVLVAKLREAGAQVPMMVMSGMAGAGSYEERANALGVPLLAKPLTREALVTAVQTALAKHANA